MKKRLKEVCEFYSGTGFPIKYQGYGYGDLPFYKVSDIANNEIMGNCFLDVCNNYISYDTVREIKGTVIPRNVVVFAKIGEALKLNRRCITSSDCLIDNNVMGIGCNEKYLDLKYFYFFMKNLKIEKLAESTTVPSVRKTKLEELFIEVPNMKLQLEIARTLEVIQDIILYRQKQLMQMDKLIKARFVEMFGDPVRNTKKWNTEKLHIVAPINKYKGNVDVVDGKVWLLNLDMIESYTGNILDISYEYENKMTSSTIKFDENCVLYSKLRPYLNKVVIPEMRGYATSELISMGTEKINKYFLANLLRQDSFVDFSNSTSYGAKMPRASIDEIKNFNLIMPPRELQNEFATFVEQVNKSKLLAVSQPQIHIYKTLTLL